MEEGERREGEEGERWEGEPRHGESVAEDKEVMLSGDPGGKAFTVELDSLGFIAG